MSEIIRGGRLLLPVIFLAAGLSCAGEEGAPPPPSRPMRMGFTTFPGDGGSAGLARALTIIARDGDLLVAHYDGGVPWDAALADSFPLFPADMRGDVAALPGWRPPGHHLLLSLTPISFLRNGLAPTRGENGEQRSLPPWNALAFDDTLVIAAYTNYCRMLVERTRPNYLVFAIEANLLRIHGADSLWAPYVELAEQTYRNLRALYPDLPLIQTVQVEGFYSNPASQEAAIRQLLAFTDILALSSYPYADALRYPDGAQADPAALPAGYFDRLADLAPGKPLAFSETGWPAEDLDAPYPLTLRSSESAQAAYVTRVASDLERRGGAFLVWFFTHDYDDLWASALSTHPQASLFRLWRDTGLYNGAGAARSAGSAWRAFSTRPYRPQS